jgi:hypothetical protein
MLILRRSVLFAICLALSGCVSYGRVISHDAIEFNKAYERFSNEQILLNAVRASKNRPMKFTSLGTLNGDLTVTTAASFTVPIGPGVENKYGASPSISVSKNPSFSMGIQNRDQDFIRGILSPIDPATLRYFYQQGWDTLTLVNLFGERIEVEVEPGDCAKMANGVDPLKRGWCRCDPHKSGARKCVRLYKNNPNASEGIPVTLCAGAAATNTSNLTDAVSEICGFLAILNQVGSAISLTQDTKGYGPSVHPNQADFLEQLIGAADKKLSIACVDSKGALLDDCPRLQAGVQLQKSSSDISLPLSSPQMKNLGIKKLKRNGVEKSPEVQLVLRSTQGVLYYLGELIEAKLNDSKKRTLCLTYKPAGSFANLVSDEKCSGRQLFFVEKSWDFSEPQIASTIYSGGRYVIPDVGRHDSSVVLSIVDYLIGLHQKAENLPSLRRVKIVGQ